MNNAHRQYTLRTANAGSGEHHRLAIVRQVEQGNGDAQEAARDLIDDLAPSLVLGGGYRRLDFDLEVIED